MLAKSFIINIDGLIEDSYYLVNIGKPAFALNLDPGSSIPLFTPVHPGKRCKDLDTALVYLLLLSWNIDPRSGSYPNVQDIY